MTPSASHRPASLPTAKTVPGGGHATGAPSGAPKAGSYRPVFRLILLRSKRGLAVALIAMLVPLLAACPQKKEQHQPGGNNPPSLSEGGQGPDEIPGVSFPATTPPPQEIPGVSPTQTPAPSTSPTG